MGAKAVSRIVKPPTDLVIPDIHFPNHHVPSLRTVLGVARELRPRRVILLGDALDCTPWTGHLKTKLSEREVHSYLSDEIDPLRAYLAELRRWTGEIHFVGGNHEAWPERLLANLVRVSNSLVNDIAGSFLPQHQLADLVDSYAVQTPDVDMDDAVGIPHFEIAPNLWAVHGWSHSKHSAAKHMEMAMGTVSVVYGHTHRQQSAVSRNPVTNEYVMAWSPGCLCKFQPMYRHGTPTTWSRGFSVIRHSKRDPLDWQQNTYLIRHDGRAILEGGLNVKPQDYRWSAK